MIHLKDVLIPKLKLALNFEKNICKKCIFSTAHENNLLSAFLSFSFCKDNPNSFKNKIKCTDKSCYFSACFLHTG